MGTDRWGVADGWWSTSGDWVDVDPASREALRSAIGEPGASQCWFVEAGDTPELLSASTVVLDAADAPEGAAGIDSVEVRGRLPADLPVGAHELRSHDGHLTHLFVLPGAAPALRRGWGWAAQLHGVRSTRNWGHGDLADLARLGGRCASEGATVVAHNPLGPPVPVHPIQPSPYYASSRRVTSPLYVAVEDVPGAEVLGADLAAAAAAGRALRHGARIDHDRCWDLVRSTLRALWDRLGRPAEPEERRRRPHADATHGAWRRAVSANARFSALAEAHGGGWTTWPPGLHHAGSAAVVQACDRLSEDVRFWHWAFSVADDQLAAARAAGPGLLADLPVGFDPGGADAWQDAPLLAAGCRIGAPPDDFAPQGQDWGLPPYVPWRLRAEGYRPWLDTLRCAMRNASALRVDHVMGLMRLYWIPAGADPSGGGYVHSAGTEMLSLAVMEAHRLGVALVGEDLGTVDDAVRAAMAQRGVAGYRIAWFEDTPPAEWPEPTLAMATTHDLPTIAGLWDGTDAEDRRRCGFADDPEGDDLLRRRVARLSGVGPDAAAQEVVAAAHLALGDAGSAVTLATLEDAVGVRHRPNLPGTLDCHPNWRARLPVDLEELPLANPFGAGRAADRTA